MPNLYGPSRNNRNIRLDGCYTGSGKLFSAGSGEVISRIKLLAPKLE